MSMIYRDSWKVVDEELVKDNGALVQANARYWFREAAESYKVASTWIEIEDNGNPRESCFYYLSRLEDMLYNVICETELHVTYKPNLKELERVKTRILRHNPKYITLGAQLVSDTINDCIDGIDYENAKAQYRYIVKQLRKAVKIVVDILNKNEIPSLW